MEQLIEPVPYIYWAKVTQINETSKEKGIKMKKTPKNLQYLKKIKYLCSQIKENGSSERHTAVVQHRMPQ